MSRLIENSLEEQIIHFTKISYPNVSEFECKNYQIKGYPMSLHEKINNGQLWPKDVEIRRFNFFFLRQEQL